MRTVGPTRLHLFTKVFSYILVIWLVVTAFLLPARQTSAQTSSDQVYVQQVCSPGTYGLAEVCRDVEIKIRENVPIIEKEDLAETSLPNYQKIVIVLLGMAGLLVIAYRYIKRPTTNQGGLNG